MAENDQAGGAPPPATDAAVATAAAAAAAAAKPPSQPGEAAAAAGTEAPPPAPPAGEQPPPPPPPPTPPPGAPEKYTLALPGQTPLDAADVAHFETYARAHNLTNEQAQAALQEHSDAVVANNQRLRATLEKDPEVGGANLAAVQMRTNALLDQYLPASTPDGAELRQVLTKQGLGDFTPLVKLLNNIAKARGEDQLLSDRGGGRSGQQRDAASVLFPSNKS